MMWRFKNVLAVILAVGMMVAAGCGGAGTAGKDAKPEAKADTGDIVIGWSMSLSGGTADMGQSAKWGTEIALDDYKAAKGKYADRVKIKFYDDEAKPEKSVENVTRLIKQDKAIAIIGPVNTGNALAHIKISQDSKVPQVVSVATGTPITQQFKAAPKNYIFRTSQVDSGQVIVFGEAIIKKGIKKVAVFHDTSGYGSSGMKDAVAFFEKKGMKPVAVESFQIGDTDMTAQLNRAKAAGAEVIATFALAPELAQLLKSADKIGWYPPMYGSWTWSQPVLVKLAGLNLIEKFQILMVQSFVPEMSQKAASFDQKMRDKYGDNPMPVTAAQSHDATRLILRALDQVGPDPEKLRDAIENMIGFTEGVTAIKDKPFPGKDNHESIDESNMFLGTYKKGRIVKAD